MNFFQFIPVIALFVSPVLLFVFLSKGYLSADALDIAPNRRIGLCPCNKALLIEFALTIIAAIALIAIAQGVLTAIFGDLKKLGTLSIDKRMVVQLVLQIASQGPFVLFLIFQAWKTRNGLRKIGYLPHNSFHGIGVGILGLFSALILVFATIIIASLVGLLFNQPTHELGHQLLREVTKNRSFLPIALSIIMAVVIAPIFEESIFRGLIQSSLVEMFGGKRRWLALGIASAIFMCAHLGGEVNWQALPGLFVLGIILGWVYERTGNLWANITIHMGFNLYNILITLLVLPKPS